MAGDTDISLRNKVIYSIFVRNYSQEGTFRAVENDLDRIKELGVDIIWLMPIHPIGKKKRKGNLGSPYANMDYRSINPEYGTLDDFRSLVDSIHDRGMKCIIDVVYNHTSPDSILSAEHPEWFYKNENGTFGNKVGDWSDIIDLDYSNTDLWDYHIETLKMWAEIVDGFRCDVAPVIPIEFWIKARKEVAKVRKDCIWLAESIEYEFINTMRRQGFIAQSDCEMYSAFDICYDYDIYNDLMDYFMGKGNISSYIDALNRQESIYPDNYVKLHFLENHDRLRAHKMIENPEVLINFTAFLYFMKGSVLLYNGQEIGDKHFISLFEKETVDWNFNKYEENSGGGIDLENLLKTLYKIKKKKVFTDGYFKASIKENHIIYAEMEDKESRIIGIFEIDEHKGNIESDIEDGFYKNLIDGKEYEVRSEILTFTGSPIIFEIKK